MFNDSSADKLPFAGAAFPRIYGNLFWLVQKMSSNRTFSRVKPDLSGDVWVLNRAAELCRDLISLGAVPPANEDKPDTLFYPAGGRQIK